LQDIPNEEIIVNLLKSFSPKPMWFIVMIGGGRFSAAIFKGIRILIINIYIFKPNNLKLI